jgi:1,4-alpha-glucan branching enzyme
MVGDLNRLYRDYPALHDCEYRSSSFEWIDLHDSEKNVLSFLRKAPDGHQIAIVCNFSPVVRTNYRFGAPAAGLWKELFNSDALQYGGSGQGNFGGVDAVPIPLHGRPYSLTVTLPPLAAVFFEHAR